MNSSKRRYLPSDKAVARTKLMGGHRWMLKPPRSKFDAVRTRKKLVSKKRNGSDSGSEQTGLVDQILIETIEDATPIVVER